MKKFRNLKGVKKEVVEVDKDFDLVFQIKIDGKLRWRLVRNKSKIKSCKVIENESIEDME